MDRDRRKLPITSQPLAETSIVCTATLMPHADARSFDCIVRFAALICSLAMTSPAPAMADVVAKRPLILTASNVSDAAISPLVPVCSRAAGVEVRANYANNPAVASEIESGTKFDVVVLETHMLNDLSTKSLVARSSMRPLAALRMGIATSERGWYGRTDTEASFKHALLGARSIGYAGHSGEVFLGLVDRLGLRQALIAKLIPFTGGYPGAAKASKRVQFIVAPFFKPLPSPLRLVGYFPASLAADIDVSVGASPQARPEAAAFIACLRSARARAIFAAKGYRLDR